MIMQTQFLYFVAKGVFFQENKVKYVRPKIKNSELLCA